MTNVPVLMLTVTASPAATVPAAIRAFVVLLTSSLVLLGIPAAWQKVFVGSALILGIGLSGWRATNAERNAPIPHSRMKD